MVNATREGARVRDSSTSRTIQQLPRLTVAVLKIKYQEVFGEDAKIPHKQYLVRRIAWRLQAEAQGDLTERARFRIAQIADVADLSRHAPKVLRAEPPVSTVPAPFDIWRRQRDCRLPDTGTVLRRRYQGREVVATVLAEGFEYESKVYRSLSAIAREITGTQWNGWLFFGLTERRNG
jgi:hypothetical protein